MLMPVLNQIGDNMSYSKPEISKYEVNIKVRSNADEMSSCKGGQCVKAIYENDRP